MIASTNIKSYLDSLPENTKEELTFFHQQVLEKYPNCRIWFLDGKDASGKVISNPNMGYGSITLPTKTNINREFYKLGISANSKGFSIYFMGLTDRNLIQNHLGHFFPNSKITGYCLNLKSIKKVELAILDKLIQFGMNN